MLYPRKHEKTLDRELFENPTSEYRGAPFWAWNGKLDREELARQIRIFRKMGMGGFHIHVRTGMDTPYLSEEFMAFVRFCTRMAGEEHMLAWLYDEDRWPSGTAGGAVTADKPENARKTLLLTVNPYTEERPHRNTEPEPGRGQESMRQDNGELLAVYDIVLDEKGCLKSARRIKASDEAEGVKWYAYREYATADPWFNNQAYVDTLRPEAIREFISRTHEKYREGIGEYFEKTVPAIFTDEPQFAPKETLAFAAEQKDVFLPWTDGLCGLYEKQYGEDLLDGIPQLLWELPEGKLSKTRWQYQNLLTDLFVSSYCRQIGEWCRANHLYMTGHVMGEPTLESQTQVVGDAMRCYPEFGIPGIDMLCDFHEYTTAKQAQSMVRQTGAEGMLSEIYGVTGWDYDFRGYKLQGDWQAALGVTVRVPHLAWMTMKGEAKRDYPASISYQSPWWDQFALIEDHFARINTAMTRGKAAVKVAVVHPIESYWLCQGPADQTMAVRKQMDEQFVRLAQILLFGGIDFDYLCEARLPEQCEKGGFPLRVGEMAYDVVIVPSLRTMRSTTLNRLEAFAREGGRVIFLGERPDHIDAERSDSAEALFAEAVCLGFDESAILQALEDVRLIDIRKEDGSRTDSILHQFREDGEQRWLFVCNGKNPDCPDVDPAPKLRFILKGEYAPELYDTMSGGISPIPVEYENGCTILERRWYMHDSMLLRLTPGRCGISGAAEKDAGEVPDILLRRVDVTLEEPNMLLLDLAEYAVNGGEFASEEELLRIDNAVREELGIPLRRKEVCQPYLIREEEAKDRLQLRFRIESEVDVAAVKLGMEDAALAKVCLNGRKIPARPEGWYVDRCIQTVPLPGLKKGENILEIDVPIGTRTNLEYFYLLGDFGVRVCGSQKTVTAPVKKLGWGDIVSQGLPFYTGNLLYSFTVRSEGDFILRVPQYRGGLIKVLVDGRDAGNIVFSPYELNVRADAGEHLVQLKLYGTRQNGFAQLHHTQGVYFYQSPNSWRSAGDLWSYEYRFKPAGILKSPEIYAGFSPDETGRRRVTRGRQIHMTDRS